MSSRITNGLKTLRIRVGGAVGSVSQQRHYGAQLKEVEVPPKPKRPLTPYFRFLGQVRTDMQKQNPSLKPTELMRVIAQRWEQLDESAKESYISAYKNDMVSFTSILEKYKKSLTPAQIEAQQQSKLQLPTLFTPTSLKLLNKYLIKNNTVRLFSSSSLSDKEDMKGSSTSSSATESNSEAIVTEENQAQSLEESSESEPLPVTQSETQESPALDQRESEWENTKLDKLYKVIELEVLAYEPSVLDSYQWFVVSAATHLGIEVGKCWSPLKSEKMRFNLLKSAFVHKKHQVHYEVRTHHRFLTFHKLTSSTADTFLEYIERNLPEGVGLKVTRVEAKALPDYLQKQAQN